MRGNFLPENRKLHFDLLDEFELQTSLMSRVMSALVLSSSSTNVLSEERWLAMKMSSAFKAIWEWFIKADKVNKLNACQFWFDLEYNLQSLWWMEPINKYYRFNNLDSTVHPSCVSILSFQSGTQCQLWATASYFLLIKGVPGVVQLYIYRFHTFSFSFFLCIF